jgi:hypothetical protein
MEYLACAIGADKPDHTALRYVEIDVAKSLHHTEALAYPSGRIDDRHGATFPARY